MPGKPPATVRVLPTVGVLLAVLFPALVAQALPLPGQDDAGSGQDAGDRADLAVAVGEGNYSGRLHPPFDDVDHYWLEAPPRVLIRVTAVAEEFTRITLSGEDDFSQDSGQPHELVAVSYGGGRWQLKIRTQEIAPEPQPYSFTIRFEPRDHFLRLEGDQQQAVAVNLTFERGDFGFAKVWVFDPQEFMIHPRGSTAELWAGRVFFPSGACGTGVGVVLPWSWALQGTLTGRSGFTDRPSAWVDTDQLQSAIHAPSELPSKRLLAEDPLGDVVYESENGGLIVEAGRASPHGVEHLGWAVWDGDQMPVSYLHGSTSRFATLEEFEGGASAQVGLVAAARGAELGIDLPEPDDAATLFLVDATTPRLGHPALRAGALDTEFVLDRPGGSKLVLRDNVLLHSSVPSMITNPTDYVSGPWTVRVEHADGVEGDHIRVQTASFPFPASCP